MQLVGGPGAAITGPTYVPGERAFWPGGDELGQFVNASDFAMTDLVQATFVAGGETVLRQSTFELDLERDRTVPGRPSHLRQPRLRHELPGQVPVRGAVGRMSWAADAGNYRPLC